MRGAHGTSEGVSLLCMILYILYLFRHHQKWTRTHELRQNGACHQQPWQEKKRTVGARRHDTLCVRGVFPLFLLEQDLATFGDSNPGGKTTLILTINTTGMWYFFLPHRCRTCCGRPVVQRSATLHHARHPADVARWDREPTRSAGRCPGTE